MTHDQAIALHARHLTDTHVTVDELAHSLFETLAGSLDAGVVGVRQNTWS